MSIDQGDIDDGAHGGASQLLARAAASLGRADRGLAAAIDDFFVSDDDRLDDRTRATLAAALLGVVAATEDDLRREAARLLKVAGDEVSANRVNEGGSVFDQLADAGVLRDPRLMRELIGRTRQDVLADGLSTMAPDEGGGSSLLARLSASADTQVASAALDLMAMAARRREFLDTGRLGQSELPAELHHLLVWPVAAAISERAGTAANRALGDAALRALSTHDEADCLEGAAMRLAAAIDPQPSELPVLLTHALGDRNVAFFAALLARALRIDFATARDLVVGGNDPLWLALRAIDLDRATIARIALALSKDVESFADQLDEIMTVTADEARAALAPLSLHPDFRAAIQALGSR
ncbi:hypothetical protein [Sphingomonas sp.]|jgi:hypothetical protein|uniref:hypothetical protein n=1 Tax=Sphingomonas sp. TaxID=28214 RepID=UPI002E336EED|nr:hypothetical protein [Sphingomonas sp.]HEX4694024.1 hypothetical protein [Sphingomonas sp.]